MQWLTSGECPLNNGPELAVEHPNSNLKIHIVAHDNMWLIKSNYTSINAYTRLESLRNLPNNDSLCKQSDSGQRKYWTDPWN